MAGKYRTPRRAKKITLSEDRYLRCECGRWKLYRRLRVANSPTEEYAWLPLPVSPSYARRLMTEAGIEGGEE